MSPSFGIFACYALGCNIRATMRQLLEFGCHCYSPRQVGEVEGFNLGQLDLAKSNRQTPLPPSITMTLFAPLVKLISAHICPIGPAPHMATTSPSFTPVSTTQFNDKANTSDRLRRPVDGGD